MLPSSLLQICPQIATLVRNRMNSSNWFEELIGYAVVVGPHLNRTNSGFTTHINVQRYSSTLLQGFKDKDLGNPRHLPLAATTITKHCDRVDV